MHLKPQCKRPPPLKSCRPSQHRTNDLSKTSVACKATAAVGPYASLRDISDASLSIAAISKHFAQEVNSRDRESPSEDRTPFGKPHIPVRTPKIDKAFTHGGVRDGG
ncbi:hypothetical protein J6590_084665 [Homalodisca vitripennis]|nr:hypothetical protein J6590_084665 [Homalodisca vitripennis]